MIFSTLGLANKVGATVVHISAGRHLKRETARRWSNLYVRPPSPHLATGPSRLWSAESPRHPQSLRAAVDSSAEAPITTRRGDREGTVKICALVVDSRLAQVSERSVSELNTCARSVILRGNNWPKASKSKDETLNNRKCHGIITLVPPGCKFVYRLLNTHIFYFGLMKACCTYIIIKCVF